MSTTSNDASTARHSSAPGRRSADAATINSAIALRLELLGVPAPAGVGDPRTDRLVSPILARQREIAMRKVLDAAQIYPVFRELFKKEGVEA